MGRYKKPNLQIFKKALNQLNVKPNHSVLVGDHPENDVKASQNVGMKSIWKKDLQWDNVNADFIVLIWLIYLLSLKKQIKKASCLNNVSG